MMQRIKNASKYFCLFFVGVFTFHLSFLASDTQKTGFNIEVIYPDNQINEAVTYFDLAIEPQLEQTLHIVVTSYDQYNVIPVALQVTNAYTTALGEVAYAPSNYRAESLQVALSDMLIPEASIIELQPLEVRTVALELKVPNNIAQGIVLGSIYATPQIEASTDSTQNGDVAFANTYAIAKGVQLNYGNTPEPNIALQKIAPGMFNRKPTFLLTVENISPTFLKNNCQVRVHIVHEESGKITNFQSNIFSMAPQTQVDLPLALESDRLQQGHYVADVTFTVGDKVVSKQLKTIIFQTMKAQAQVESGNKETIPTWVVSLMLIMALIIVGGLIYILREKQRQQNN